MKNIRSLINLVENKTAPTVSPQAVYDEAKTIATVLTQRLGVRDFEQNWIEILKSEIRQAEENHNTDQAEQLEYDETHVRKPFDMAEYLPDALSAFWQKVQHEVSIRSDADYELREYSKANRTIELSDTITVLNAEKELGWKIDNSGLGDLPGMVKSLDALDEYSSYVEKYSDVDRFRDYTDSTGRLISSGIPLILFYTKLLGAKKP